MKLFLRILKWTGIVLVVLLVGFWSVVQATWKKTFDAPMPAIVASTDSAVIARGKYLVFGPAHCADCHIKIDQLALVEKGEEIALSGGFHFRIPPGDIVSPNLTPDPETGIGNITDAQIARALRYGVGHRGNALANFMAFQHLSDEDLTAVISYLRSRPAVKHDPGQDKWNFLGKMAMAMGMVKPFGPTEDIPVSVTPDSTASYGRYLTHSVANCMGCHTQRNMMTGAFVGPEFAGGFRMPSEFHKERVYVTPNLTPDKATGHLTNWEEQDFIDRFREGRLYEDSPMPWASFSNFSDNDLKAIYRYLMSLKPVNNATGPSLQQGD